MLFDGLVLGAGELSCYGLEVIGRSLRRHGHDMSIGTLREGSTILWSCYWPEQLYDFVLWLKKHGIEIGKRSIVAGGNTPTGNPAMAFPWASRVFVGEGDDWDGELDGPNMARPDGEAAELCVAEHVLPMSYTETRGTTRTCLEISRGCRNRCVFCQYGHIRPYREASVIDIGAVVDKRKTKSLRLVAADRFQHSRLADIETIVSADGAVDASSDTSVRFVLKNPKLLGRVRRVRVGIEGMSERLRAAVGKPLLDDEIVELMARCKATGIGAVIWYMIRGLPGETENDAEQFVALLSSVGEHIQGGTLFVTWNAFQPNPLTPLQWATPAYEMNTERHSRVMAHRVPGASIAHHGSVTSPARMLRRMVAVRAAGEATAKLVFNLATRPKLFRRPDVIRRAFVEATGFDAVGELPTSTVLPWDGLVRYDRPKLEHRWRAYQSRLGIA